MAARPEQRTPLCPRPAVSGPRPAANTVVRQAVVTALAVGALASCAVGPNFKPPAPPTTKSYVAGDQPASTVASDTKGGSAQRYVEGLDIPGQWWTLFKSAQLNELIDRALARNPTLEAAQAALRQANETLAAQRGSFFPAVSGSVGAQRSKSTGAAFGEPQLGSFYYTLNSATVNVSYGIDAFGGTRRQIEALQAQSDYERYALEASYLSLTANIVTTAVSEASVRAQIAATEEIAHSQQIQLEIVERRLAVGGASRADLAQQQAALAVTLASLPPLRNQLVQYRNQLATYTGDMPADFQGGAFTLDSLTLPEELPVSLPSKLVEQRPDVREYSALLHAATAQVGVATANMLPQLTLTGSFGGEAVHFSDVFNPASVVWTIAGSVTQPIFKGGQLMHQRRAAIAAAQQAAANYKSTVLTAFQNVSNTLTALQSDADALAASATAERAAAVSLDLVRVQYASGAASYVQVLSAEQSYQTAAIALVKARAQRYADTAALFQALGGGWWNRRDIDSKSSDCCKGHT
jgi:NodT family efflux transporter outer membrane factor (OMF) lipoprotein